MKYYFNYKTKNNLILSCDMLRLKFKCSDLLFKNFTQFLRDSEFNNYISYKFYESHKSYSYRNLFEITLLDTKNVFVIGIGFNSFKSSEYHHSFIEFNPNKCLYNNSILFDFIRLIKTYTSGFELSRFDLAIDIPMKRSCVYLDKDLRNYSKCYHIEVGSNNIENFTEYLGKRNNNGFVKLYNKTIEQHLDYDLTRLELTFDSYDYENFIEHLPRIYYLKNIDLFDYNNLNDTDKVLLSLLYESPNKNIYLKMLGRVKQEKLRNLIFNSIMLDITSAEYFTIIEKIKQIYA